MCCLMPFIMNSRTPDLRDLTAIVAPDCTITGDFDVCFGQTTQLCAPAGYASYAWSTGALSNNCITVSASGTYYVTVTDVDGLTSVCSQVVTISDTVPPQLFCPADVTIECDASTLPVDTGLATATDACDPTPVVTYVDLLVGGGCTQAFTITRTWTVTDAAGNTTTCAQSITGVDTTAPVISCPFPDSPIACGSTQEFGLATAIDACDALVDITFTTDTIPAECGPGLTVIRTCTATDDCGNTSTCSATIIVEGNPLPIITCNPSESPIECGATPNFANPTMTEPCSGNFVITYITDSIPGMCGSGYSLVRTWTATDECGFTAECSSTILVQDLTAPVITCPADIEALCNISTDPSVTGTATAVDNCNGPSVISYTDILIEGNCPMILSRTWTATDECGNIATCIQTIEVTDNTPPQIVCASVSSPIDCGDVPDFGAPIVMDDCDVTVDITFITDSIQGTCGQEYTLTRTWTAIDGCGNLATCSSTIVVQDLTSPTITCVTQASPVTCPAVPVFTLPVATDVCDASVTMTFVDATTQGSCAGTYSVTRTWTASDDCGNTAVCSGTIVVNDLTAPIIACPVVISPIVCGAALDFGTATATDACDASVSITFIDVTVPGACPQGASVTRTWIATDDCGNASSCSSTIVIEDATALLIECPDALTVQCADEVPAVDISLIQASGNCGIMTITHLGDVITDQSCSNNFTLTRTYLASDICGNTIACNQIITVLDTTPPELVFNNPALSHIGDTIRVQCYGQDPEWDIPTYDASSISATDFCGGEVIITYTDTLEDQGNCSADGYSNLYRLSWTATDVCGNSSNAYVFLALVDTIPPVIHEVPVDITVNCDDLPWPAAVYATDECLCACVVLFEETERLPQTCQNGLVIIRSWTATDRCGNVTVETQRITLIDRDGPAMEIMQPELAGVTNDTVIYYTCNEGGFPSYYDTLNAESVLSASSCGGTASISFEENSSIVNNCEFYGYIEQRIYQWTGTDACGNTSNLTITARLIDNEAPVITGVPEMACIGDPKLRDVYVIDNCDDASVRFWDVSIPNPCGIGTAMRRTYEAVDQCGNMSRDTVILVPNSGILPILTFTDTTMAQLEPQVPMTINCAAHGQQYTAFGIEEVIVTGGCSQGTTVRFVETLLSNGDCATNGIVALVELKWIATDMCGYRSEKVLLANIVDESSPVFTLFSPELFVGCHDSIPVMAATDNCGDVTISMVDIIVPGTCADEYDIARTYTATDPCNNSTVLRQIIHVGNPNGPTIVGVEEEICDDLTLPVVTAYDACAGQLVDVVMLQDTLDSTCRNGFVIQRTWSATDACGHTSEIVQTIVMNDLTPPEINIPSYSIIYRFLNNPDNLVYHSQFGMMNALNELDDESVSVDDDCDQVIIPVMTVDTLFALNCDSAGYAQRRTYTWLATDICGNSSSISFTIDVIDDLSPEFPETPGDTIIMCSALPPVPVMVMVDTLEPVRVIYTQVMTPGSVLGQMDVIRTWVAYDSCHNEATISQHIIWQPESTLECSIILPEVVDCNSHGVNINSDVIGGAGLYSYEWQIVGEKCFLQSGQGTPEIQIYMGWADVNVILMVTDSFGCVSVCTALLHCIDQTETELSIFEETNPGLTIHDPSVMFEQTGIEVGDNKELVKLNVWPNPVTETLNFSFESNLEGIVEYSFTNFLGQTVLKEKMNVLKGYNAKQIDAATLPNGSYLMQIKSDMAIYTRVIVVLKNG